MDINDTPKDLITVVVPIFNVEIYLEKCINSILNQSYEKLQIILVDDGSTDNCSKICDEYKEKDSRVTVIHKTNGGLSDARNAGIELANGKYITFIDSDDWIEKDYIKYLYNLINNNHADISICEYKYISESGKILNRYKGNSEIKVMTVKEAMAELCTENNFSNSAWAKMYLTNLFENVRYPKGKIFEDIPVTYKLFDKCETIVFGAIPLYNYLHRKNAISKNAFSIKRLNAIEFTEEMAKYISNQYPDLTYLCNKKMFVECVYTYKCLCSSKKYDKNIGESLYIKLKEYNKKGIYSFLGTKMKIYSISVKLGKAVLFIYTKLEEIVSKFRI